MTSVWGVVNANLMKDHAPTFLRTVNTIGCRMYGFHPVVRVGDERVLGLSLHAFCVLFVPLLPLAWYLVETPDYQSYRFHGRVPWAAVKQVLGNGGAWRMVGSIFGGMIVAQMTFVVVVAGVIALMMRIRSCG